MSHGFTWFWHRLRAMRLEEVRERIAQKLRKRADGRRPPDFSRPPSTALPAGPWPALPPRETAPEPLLQALHTDTASILNGHWRGFGHLELRVDDPPKWFLDPTARRELATGRPGFQLNHRKLPEGCDIKVVWELSRWQHLVRLAQGAWLLQDARCLKKCVDWLEHWARKNPPYIGWNWTSALESGIRLINLAWIDGLLTAAGADERALQSLRQRLVPSHLWYTWRHRSFGSSANNHLLGELAGLVVAAVRWPSFVEWGAPLSVLQPLLEKEILAQFAPDGGNREQALNYQLFAWELAWHARNALAAAGHPLSAAAEERLHRAADFFVTVQVPSDTWDYGDSDSATVTPLVTDETSAVTEWHGWFAEPNSSPALRWWLGNPPDPVQPPACLRANEDWLIFPETGQAVCWSGAWNARWDLSPLGYLSTAAHGHLDALHVSLWLGGVALVIDPGTGAYYGDVRLRSWLASWAAHNGPHVPGTDFPRRLGPFLWGDPHRTPTWTSLDSRTLAGELPLPHGTVSRHIRRLSEDANDGWQVDDLVIPAPAATTSGFRVCWQFAPGTRLEATEGSPRFFRGERLGVRFSVGFDSAWSQVRFFPETLTSVGFPVTGDLAGLCSPAFRRILAGPYVELTARGANPSRYRTTFLAEPAA